MGLSYLNPGLGSMPSRDMPSRQRRLFHGKKKTRFDVRRQNVPETLVCDQALVRVALTNLLSNALRFSPPQRPVRLVVERPAAGCIAFTVSDDGPGIPADELPKLFQKFFRGRHSQLQPGAGLGLYLVEKVAQVHGGTIAVQSREGQGAIFVLTLPAK